LPLGGGIISLENEFVYEERRRGRGKAENYIAPKIFHKLRSPDVPESAAKIRTKEFRIEKRRSEETKIKINLRMRLRSS
jgi:hypothetical protein